MSSLLFGVTALDPVTYAAVSALLIAAAVLASYLPARRAIAVDPVQALRRVIVQNGPSSAGHCTRRHRIGLGGDSPNFTHQPFANPYRA
jgi:hypothetical protein